MTEEICECGHPKRFHSHGIDTNRNKRDFCTFSDKTENWNMPEEAKKKYLEAGINELAVCECHKFRPAKPKQKEGGE